MRSVFAAMFLSLTSTWASAETNDKQVVCSVSGCNELALSAPTFASVNAFSTQQVWSVVNEILAVSGLLPNFQVMETTEVGNAAAVIYEGERFLAFNPDWLAQYKSDPNAYWQLMGVMAHEVGHHLQGHTLTGLGSRPPTELEADEYAGFVLAALGATLKQSQSLWATLSETGSATHPPRHQRLAAVERGWLKRQNMDIPPVQSDQPASAPPRSTDLPAPQAFQNGCRGIVAARTASTVCTSSWLSPQGSNSYGLGNLSDNDGRTAWVEGARGHGIGEGILVKFPSPTSVFTLSLRNGYQKSDRTFTRNSRVRMLEISSSAGEKMTLRLSDQTGWQTGTLSGLSKPVTWVLFTVSDVFPGSHYTDTAITEFELR